MDYVFSVIFENIQLCYVETKKNKWDRWNPFVPVVFGTNNEVTNLYDVFKPDKINGTDVGWTQIQKDGASESATYRQ